MSKVPPVMDMVFSQHPSSKQQHLQHQQTSLCDDLENIDTNMIVINVNTLDDVDMYELIRGKLVENCFLTRRGVLCFSPHRSN